MACGLRGGSGGLRLNQMHDFKDLTSLERTVLATIPIARAMQLSASDYDGHRLALTAPLAPNVNDKGCAFGGSLVSLMTLAAWGLVNIKLAEAGLSAAVYVQDSSVEYLAPVWAELIAEAAAGPEESWPAFIAAFEANGRARIAVAAEVSGADGGLVAAKFLARFVAKAEA